MDNRMHRTARQASRKLSLECGTAEHGNLIYTKRRLIRR